MNTAGIFLPIPCSPGPEIVPQIAVCIPSLLLRVFLPCCTLAGTEARWDVQPFPRH